MMIEQALTDNPQGMRFTKIKQATGLHQDTLAIRLKELVRKGNLQKSGRIYKISRSGTKDLYNRWLIRSISSSPSHVVVGGPDAGSIYPEDIVILRSTIGFAYLRVHPTLMGDLRMFVHKYWMLHQLAIVARKYSIDTQPVTKDTPAKLLLRSLERDERHEASVGVHH
jgi:hypothetical protein